MKEASPRYAVTSPRAHYRPGVGEKQADTLIFREDVMVHAETDRRGFGTMRPAITNHLANIFLVGDLAGRQHVPFWNMLPALRW